MATFTCPHCDKLIELVGQKELSEEYGMGPNPVAHARSRGTFPTPVLQFGNRNMWLKDDIDPYIEQRATNRITKLVADFEQVIAGLPEEEQKQVRETLASVAGDGTADH
jgi:predicted DNA-binding transcriptional regulator AlpA